MTVRIIEGDCRLVMPGEGPFDMILVDPPYGQTSLGWDKRVDGWERVAAAALKPSGSMWLFGSMRLLLETWPALTAAGWRYVRPMRDDWYFWITFIVRPAK